MAYTDRIEGGYAARPHNRWVQLVAGILCMGLVANLQYAWTLFVVPMDARHHWGQAAIQLALPGLRAFGHDPYVFMLFSGLVFLFYGDIFSNFPATSADTFGARYAAGNAGTLYTAKGTAAMLVPVATVLALHGGWNMVFDMVACVAMMAGVCAKVILQPMRRRWIFQSGVEAKIADSAFAPSPLGSHE